MQSTAATQRSFSARPRPGALADVALAAVVLGCSLALLSHGGIGPVRSGPELDLLGGLLAAFAAAPLLAWRSTPFGAFVIAAAASTLAAGVGYAVGVPLAATAALYLLAASRDESHPWTRRINGATVALFVSYLAVTAAAEDTFPASELLHTGLAWAVAWFAGERARLRREHVSQLEERALRAERETERERRLATAEERARIARDLHDSAGHAISVIALRAGTARLRHREDPERSHEALEAIERLARQTVGEIDGIVGTLREDAPSPPGVVEPPSGLASLQTLLERHTAAGLDVTVASAGVPRPLGAPVDQATYRILQEALTNASRHGAGSALIEIAFGTEDLELTVANPVPAGGTGRPSGGHGLIGMRERATLLGGRLDAERVNGAFRLRARLPYTGHRA